MVAEYCSLQLMSVCWFVVRHDGTTAGSSRMHGVPRWEVLRRIDWRYRVRSMPASDVRQHDGTVVVCVLGSVCRCAR